MALNPLTPVTDYQSTLNRIFWFTSVAALGAIWLLRRNIPAVESLLGRVDLELQTGAGRLLPLPAGYLLPAVTIGIVSRVFRLHSYLGHWLGVRERFEIDVILNELGRRAGLDLSHVTEEQWQQQRHALMRKTFYYFTNGRHSIIDEHLVQQALDSWSWFWVLLEASVVWIGTSLILIAAGDHETGLISFTATLLTAAGGLPAIRWQCKIFALAQVRAIIADPEGLATVRESFSALSAPAARLRSAA